MKPRKESEQAALARCRRQVAGLLAALEAEARRHRAAIRAALPESRASAENLSDYVALRSRDLGRLQLDLAGLGLSSLGRSEGHVRDTLLRLERWLALAAGEPASLKAAAPKAPPAAVPGRDAVEALLHRNTAALFGPRPRERHVYMMITAPAAAEATPAWARQVLRAGADLIRINAAHESPEAWLQVVRVARAAATSLSRPIRVFVDLPGPKLRADIPATQAAILRFRREKDRLGRTRQPAKVAFAAASDGTAVPLPPRWMAKLRAGDRLRLVDASGRRRSIEIVRASRGSASGVCDRSVYFAAGLRVEWRRKGERLGKGRIGALPRLPGELMLERGARFLLREPGARAAKGSLPALVCPEKGLLRHLRKGERVVLDDGRASAVVESVGRDGATCRVAQLAKEPLRLRSGKGLAFPDSRLSLPALGADDEAALRFAMKHADGVDVSFVNTARDVSRVVSRLRRGARPGFGMVLKLETRGAIRNLPAILFAALRYRPAGLMIARGDLAVEASFEELARLQEEILGFGEAAHLPVIWATQVLDSLAHSGVPTRAEVTDAAMSMRAECVMLNKGPYVAEAARMLARIIRDMEPRQFKKRSLFARLPDHAPPAARRARRSASPKRPS